MRARLTVAVAALGISLLAVAPGQAATHRCDLGPKRALRCGRVSVPLIRGEPALGRTTIAYAVRPRGNRDRPSLGAIFAVDGGPGYSSTDGPFVRSVIALLAPLLRRHELVFVDQRGTGLSDPIRCGGLQRGVTPESIAVGQ